MINVGVLGLGKMGKLHLMNCRHIDGVQVTAVADVSDSNLGWARKRGISKGYRDYSELIEKEKVDAVIIALPHFLHKESSIHAMEHGIDVFLEKPLANSLDEGKQIVETAAKTGRHLMVGCNCRFIDSVEKVKEIYDGGILGDIELANFENIGNGPFSPFLDPTPIPDWYFDPNQVGGGAVLDIGYHMIDLFQWFFQDVNLEFAYLSNRYNLPYEDSAILIVKSGHTRTKGIINLGWFSRSIFPKFNFRAVLHGTVDYTSTDMFRPNIYWNAFHEMAGNVLRKLIRKKIRPLSYTYYYYSYYKELEHFFHCIATGQDPIISPGQAFTTLQIIQDAYNKYPRK